MYTPGIPPLPGTISKVIMERIALICDGHIELIKRLDAALVEANKIPQAKERKAQLKYIAEQYRINGMPAKAQEIRNNDGKRRPRQTTVHTKRDEGEAPCGGRELPSY